MREKPEHLKIYESLDSLGALSQENQGYLSNLRKGYDGEKYVDSLFSKLSCPHFYLPDRLLEINRQTFQLDSVLITGKGVYLYEIKNYRGEYIFENNTIKNYVTGKTILKPSTQLDKTQTLFTIFMEEYRFNLPVYAYVIFINPDFTLYQLPPRQNVIMPSLLRGHLKELGRITTPLNSVHKRLVHTINNQHVLENKFSKIPDYSYDGLKKGVYCLNCHSFNTEVLRRSTCCEDCSFKEINTEVILRRIKEFLLLFPEQKLSTAKIFDWCGNLYPQSSIRRVLINNYQEVGSGRGMVYI